MAKQTHSWHTISGNNFAGTILRAFGSHIHAGTEAEAVRQANELSTAFRALNGREPTPSELRNGLAREYRPTSHVEARRRAELAGPQPPVLSAEEDLVARARERVDKARYEALTADERLLHDAEQRLAEKVDRDAAAAAKAAVLASPAAKKLLESLDTAISRALIDPTLDGEIVSEFRHKKQVVLTHALPSVIEAVSADVREMQSAIAKGLEVRTSELRSALDVLEESRRMLTSPAGAFDAVAEKMVGNATYIELTKGNQKVSVSRERWESRESDEALATTLFPSDTNE